MASNREKSKESRGNIKSPKTTGVTKPKTPQMRGISTAEGCGKMKPQTPQAGESFSATRGGGKRSNTHQTGESPTVTGGGKENPKTPKTQRGSALDCSKSVKGSKGQTARDKGKGKGKATEDGESESGDNGEMGKPRDKGRVKRRGEGKDKGRGKKKEMATEDESGSDNDGKKMKPKYKGKDKGKGRRKEEATEDDELESNDTSKISGTKKQMKKGKRRSPAAEPHMGATQEDNPCWNDPNGALARFHQTRHQITPRESREMDARIELYSQEDFPHRLMTYLQFTPKAAETFRLHGGPILERRVNELYDQEVREEPHTSRSVDADGQVSAERRSYESIRSTWHALRDRYYYATGWPTPGTEGWRDMSQRSALMQDHGSRGLSNAQRISRDRLRQAASNKDAICQIYFEIFMEIGLRRTRHALIDPAEAAPHLYQSRNLSPTAVWGLRRRPMVHVENGEPIQQPRRRTRTNFAAMKRRWAKKHENGDDEENGEEGGKKDATKYGATKKAVAKDTKGKGSKLKKDPMDGSFDNPSERQSEDSQQEDSPQQPKNDGQPGSSRTKRTPPPQDSTEGRIQYIQPVKETRKYRTGETLTQQPTPEASRRSTPQRRPGNGSPSSGYYMGASPQKMRNTPNSGGPDYDSDA